MDNLQSPRRVLATVSPNVKPVAAAAPAFMKKAIIGSPLKRSFTAAMEEGGGLLYLKRRRLGEDEILSEVDSTTARQREELQLSISLDDPLRIDLPSIEPLESPTEPNTPSEDGVAPESSAERRSFSSLINYDPSSQTPKSASTTLPSAEILRLRLRIAMYKVRTNQIDSSFENLKDEKQCRDLAHRKAIDDAVTELRKEAQEILARAAPRASSSDSPAPSSSLSSAHDRGTLLDLQWPGAFSAAGSPQKLPLPTEATTPLRTLWRTGTPPNTGSRLSHILEPELTSSVVKGRVAEGLLGLRNAS